MKYTSRLATLLALCLVGPAAAQQTVAPRPTPDDDAVVRITANLVQVDAVVIDKGGHVVNDLKPEDFEILEDGRPQQITNFSYVSTAAAAAAPSDLSAPAGANAPPAPPPRLKPEQVRRTIALVVDDLGLAVENIPATRHALRKFVDEMIQPGDLVAVVRTGSDIGALQQFTGDKRLLYHAIERVRPNLCSRVGVSVVAPVRDGAIDRAISPCAGASSPYATLRALRFIIQGMRDLPGRKSMIVLSDGIPLEQQETRDLAYDPTERALRGNPADADADHLRVGGLTDASYIDPLRRVAELAVRASVVINGIDARGVAYVYGPTAADDFAGLSGEARDRLIRQRVDYFRRNDEGPAALTRQTGGLLIQGTNDLVGGLRRIIAEQQGYYLIGYRPGEQTFDRRFHRIKVRVRRGGLRVRSRAGFYGIPEERAPARTLTPREQTLAALTSPFGASDIELQITPVVTRDAQGRAVLRSFLHVEAGKLTFTDEPDGWHKAAYEVTGLLFGDNGRVAGEQSQTETLRVRGDAYARLLREGVVITFGLPVKRDGTYQLRIAVRDVASARVGAAGEVVVVPDLDGGRLALSGLVVAGESARGTSAPLAVALAQLEGQGGQDTTEADAMSGPAVRRLRPDMALDYAFYVYNARPERADARPRLVMQTRLLREGKEIYRKDEQPLDASGATDPRRVLVNARLQPSEPLAPGAYTLQIVVTDTQAREGRRAAAQWIDFEVVQ